MYVVTYIYITFTLSEYTKTTLLLRLKTDESVHVR